MSETVRLLQEARKGSRTAFDALYARHRGRLVAFAAARMDPGLRGFVSPEDIVQETHLESARKLDAFEPRGPTSFYRWLVSIARFKISEAQRRRGRKKNAAVGRLAAEPAAAQTSPSGRVLRGELAGRVAGAIAALPEAQAEAVRLRYLEGLSLAETAERLERSVPAAKMLVSRGLRTLATEFSRP